MKFNLEIELDWIDEESGLDEMVQKRIIDEITSKIEKKITDKIEKKVEGIIDENVVSKINAKTEALFDEFLQREVKITDSYGSNIQVYESIEALMKDRFDNFLTQKVDDKGNTFTGNYGSSMPRINFIVNKQLKDFADKFTTDAVKTVSAEIKEHVKDGLTTKLGHELMNVLKVNEMLKIGK